jgi:hypothetical protein
MKASKMTLNPEANKGIAENVTVELMGVLKYCLSDTRLLMIFNAVLSFKDKSNFESTYQRFCLLLPGKKNTFFFSNNLLVSFLYSKSFVFLLHLVGNWFAFYLNF